MMKNPLAHAMAGQRPMGPSPGGGSMPPSMPAGAMPPGGGAPGGLDPQMLQQLLQNPEVLQRIMAMVGGGGGMPSRGGMGV